MKTTILKGKKGIDDLVIEHAFIGSSQGDTHRTNSLKEYQESYGWLIPAFMDEDIINQAAINRESERRKHQNESYIKFLKETGEYGKEYEIKIHFQEYPELDENKTTVSSLPLESYKMTFL